MTAARERPLCVKVCGITRAEDAVAAIEAGADLLGFNFYPNSPRFIAPEVAAPIIALLPRQVLAVGVFVDAERPAVERALATAKLGLLQFHGNESPEYCRGFAVPAIKALRVASLAALEAVAAPYPEGWVLVDTADPTRYGGTGRALPIEPVARDLARRLFVAGGLAPDTVTDVVRRLRPLGVDVCSGVERAPGIKDHALLKDFVTHAKTA
ncbi:MAG: phosphoribosylanthranilate isomerase [Deltaproteobacteria bacterium]|nr:phosphoribosylanthranilate isomerase [Deltaproteobacteria bacterium]